MTNSAVGIPHDVNVFMDWWSPTGQKFQPPDPGKSHDYDEKQRKGA
jgi:hypothetical protein